MLIEIVANPTAEHQRRITAALAQGLARHGIRTRMLHSRFDVGAEVVACWGWTQGRMHHANGRRVLVLECGYVGDRLAWTSLGWDGLNRRARFPAIDDGGVRWRAHFGRLMRQRRIGGDYSLVMGQVAGDAAIAGVNLAAWYRGARVALAGAAGLPVLFRPHPVERQRRPHQPATIEGMKVLDGDLESALAGAAAVASFNSNSLTDAALAGLPLLAGDEGAMAWPVAGQEFEDGPLLGPRTEWARRLAWCQWAEEEIASGAAWAVVSTAMESDVTEAA